MAPKKSTKNNTNEFQPPEMSSQEGRTLRSGKVLELPESEISDELVPQGVSKKVEKPINEEKYDLYCYMFNTILYCTNNIILPTNIILLHA